MPSMLSRLRGDEVARSGWQQLFSFNGSPHQVAAVPAAGVGRETVRTSFRSLASSTGDSWSTVGAAVDARATLLSQLRFQWVDVSDVARGRRFGTPDLTLLEDRPGGVPVSTLLYRAEQDVCFAGSAFFWRDRRTGDLRRLRPDWVDVILAGEPGAPDTELAGLSFHVNGRNSAAGAILLDAADVVVWAPEPDPTQTVVGRSWVTSVLREVLTDVVAAEHVAQYFRNAATPSMIVSAPPGVDREQFRGWVTAMDDANAGTRNSGKTMYVINGVDTQPIGSKMAELDMKAVQGGLENRISVRSRVPAVVLGVREAMQGSALNAGNYGQTRRLWADSWFTPYAQRMADTLQGLMDPGEIPRAARLTFDPTQVMLLQEDMQDAANIASSQASAIETLHRAGFEPDAAVDAVVNGDMRRLANNHTGLSSVQLVGPGEGKAQAERGVSIEYDEFGRAVGLS